VIGLELFDLDLAFVLDLVDLRVKVDLFDLFLQLWGIEALLFEFRAIFFVIADLLRFRLQVCVRPFCIPVVKFAL
jgi:hypothetical protein